MSGDLENATVLAIRILGAAQQIASEVRDRVIAMIGNGKPDFEAIMLEAVERQIMDMRCDAQRRAAEITTRGKA
jgi:hypothetical protein